MDLKEIAKDVESLCEHTFSEHMIPEVTIEESEDAPCVVIGSTISICRSYWSGRSEKIYEVQAMTIEHNYPNEPDWIDYTTLSVETNYWVAISKAVLAYLEREIATYQANQALFQEYKENCVTKV